MLVRTCRRIANSPGLLFLTFLITITAAAIAYSMSEVTDLINSVYWSLVTSATLGYGTSRRTLWPARSSPHCSSASPSSS